MSNDNQSAFNPARIEAMKNPVGKMFFFPRCNTFVKILSVEAKPSLPDCEKHLMKYVCLKDGCEGENIFIEEIGIELFPIPPEYSRERMEEYLEATKIHKKTGVIMDDTEIQIITWDGN